MATSFTAFLQKNNIGNYDGSHNYKLQNENGDADHSCIEDYNRYIVSLNYDMKNVNIMKIYVNNDDIGAEHIVCHISFSKGFLGEDKHCVSICIVYGGIIISNKLTSLMSDYVAKRGFDDFLDLGCRCGYGYISEKYYGFIELLKNISEKLKHANSEIDKIANKFQMSNEFIYFDV
jgi:hypothetical protein